MGGEQSASRGDDDDSVAQKLWGARAASRHAEHQLDQRAHNQGVDHKIARLVAPPARI
jgi:hypothetical protein